MSERWNLDRDAVIHAIFMELPGHAYGYDEDRRTAERVYERVFRPLLMFEESHDEHDDAIAAQMESHACTICGLPLDEDGCCIARCGSGNYKSRTQGRTE